MGKRKKQRRPANAEGQEDAAEELAALEAIYGDDIQIDDDRHGFSLRVLPHPAELQENLVSTVLAVRLPPGYPHAEAVLRLRDHENLALGDQRALSKRLHTAAAAFATEGAVCAFDLIDACQQFLQDRNAHAAAHPDAAAPSLWHEMQQREEDAADGEQQGGSPSRQDLAFQTGAMDGGLFSSGDAAGGPFWNGSAAPPRLTVTPAKAQHGGLRPLSAASPTAEHADQPGAAAAAAAAAATTPAPAAAAAVQCSRVAATGQAAGPAAVTRRGSGGEVSGSIVRSVFGAVRSGFTAVGRALLPPSLHKLLDGTSEVGSEVSDAAAVAESDAEALRRDVLTGHLLALATEDGLPRHALPALAASLQARGLLPKWVQWALTQQPALFDRAFRRLFAQELEAAASSAAGADPLSGWALERFWRPAAGGGAAPLRPPPPPLAGVSASAAGTSRYLTDFQEVRVLGRGAFGVVVAAVNRLDGRQYAVKRIRLDAASPAAFARLLREVATLSRLQHPHVVRYFQAWFETDDGSQAAALAAEATEDTDDWLATDSTCPPAAAGAGSGSSYGRAVSFALPRRGAVPGELQPVQEESQQGSMPESSPPNSAQADGLAAAASADSDMASAQTADASSAGSSVAESAASPTASAGADAALTASLAVSATTAPTESSGSGAGFWQRPQPTASGRPSDAPASTATASAVTGSSEADRSTQLAAADVGDTAATAKGRKSKGLQQLLYIQMEFCPRTLRQALDSDSLLSASGEVDEAAAWQVVRQMLSGLAHIHAQGIIHRDLKPDNMFYDLRGDIRLGDFGLAKFTAAGAEDDAEEQAAAAGVLRPPSAGLQSEASGIMGTSFYISPEIEQGWASYDERVDVFSAGVVVFELFRPFATGMERVITLRELRETGSLPPDFAERHPQVAQLVNWLMAGNPADRPTAREVLASELLPPTVGDQALTDMLRSLPDSPETLDRVVAAVFASCPPAASAAAGAAEVAGAPLPLQMGARDRVTETLRAVFSRHGAVAATSAAIGLATDEDDRAGAPVLLAPSGARLALRHEMRQPFAAWLARQAAAAAQEGETVDALRRYEVATVRRQGRGHGPPAAHLAADLDFVSPRAATAAEAALPEAEAILAAVEVAAAVPEAGACEVRLGHRALLDAALQYAALPGGRDARGAALQLLATAAAASPADAAARAKRWPSIRVGLEGLGLDGAAIGRCRALVLQLPGEADAALHRLRSRLAPANGGPLPAALAAALDHLQALAGHLGAWGVAPASLAVDPLLPPHADYFTAAVWQAHLLHPATGATSLLAVGGRYDALLSRLWPAAASALAAPPGAVGITLNVDRLVAAATSGLRAGRSGLPLRPSQADVLVCARGGGGLLRERMALVAALWAAGISAELLPAAAPSATAQYEYARAAGIGWMAMLQAATFSSSDTVLVKNLERKGAEEESVPYADVARYLQEAIAGSARHGSARVDLQRAASSMAATSTDADHAPYSGLAAGVNTGEGEGSYHDGTASSWRDSRRKGRR